ncbi:MAG: Wzz/FepE/Etk N-terminal domain-containing protein [Hyphomicrobiaceae bacterium]
MADTAALHTNNIVTETKRFGAVAAPNAFGSDSISQFLHRHLKTIVESMVAALVLGCAYLYFASPTYTAQTQILIDPGLPNVLRDQTIEPPMAMDSQQAETEIAVLRSERVASAVIDRVNLADDPEFNGPSLSDRLENWFLSAPSTPQVEQERARRAALAAFQRSLIVRRIGVSYAIDVFFTSSDADKSTRIANAVAEEYIRFQIETRANAAKVGSEWLEKRLDELRAEMNDAARKMQEKRARQDYSIGGTLTAPPAGSTPVEGSDQSEEAKAPSPSAPQVSLEDLETTAHTYRRIYENYLQSYMAAVQRQSFPISNARVITKAVRPLTQSRSNGLILALALLLGGLAGVGIGILRDRNVNAKAAAPAGT